MTDVLIALGIFALVFGGIGWLVWHATNLRAALEYTRNRKRLRAMRKMLWEKTP